MNMAKLCITFLLATTGSINMSAMQKQYTITDMPKEIIRHITDLLAEITIDENDDYHSLAQKKLNLASFASTCRYLHGSVTRENRIIKVDCAWRIQHRDELPVSLLLDQVFACIQHIVARDGNNPICLCLDCDELVDDMDAVALFFAKCSQKPIVQHIAYLHLATNGFTTLPRGIEGLTELKRLWLSGNNLKKEDLYRLEKIINESLHKMEEVNVIMNDVTLHDVYQTIAHCTLKELWASDKTNYQPTAEELTACKTEQISLH